MAVQLWTAIKNVIIILATAPKNVTTVLWMFAKQLALLPVARFFICATVLMSLDLVGRVQVREDLMWGAHTHRRHAKISVHFPVQKQRYIYLPVDRLRYLSVENIAK